MLNIITLSEEEIKENQNETDKKINEYISKLTDYTITNQILKAKEKKLYLILNDTFSLNEIRDIRQILLEKKFNIFFDKYKKRNVNGNSTLYKYRILTNKSYDYIVVEIEDECNLNILSEEFKYKLNLMTKETPLFYKYTSDIYKKYFPIINPEIISEINNDERWYLKKIIYNTILKLQAVELEMIRKSLQRGLVIEPKIELEKHKIKETIEVILSLSDIISEKNI